MKIKKLFNFLLIFFNSLVVTISTIVFIVFFTIFIASQVQLSYLENFNKNMVEVLIKDLKNNNCQRVMRFFQLYEDDFGEKKINLTEEIKSKCINTVFYKNYLFIEYLRSGDTKRALFVYEELFHSENPEIKESAKKLLDLIYPYLTEKEKNLIKIIEKKQNT